MLEELLPEGRRILLFSQFTSMLELRERELTSRHVSYHCLRAMRDRGRPCIPGRKGPAVSDQPQDRRDWAG